jgi:molecular chaperone GrpE
MRDEQRRGPGVSQDGEAVTGGATSPPGPPSGSGASAGSPWPADQQASEEGAGSGILSDSAALAAERDEYLTALQRLQADFENYRKRVQRQQEDGVARAEGALITKLLPVLDVLDLAQAHLGEAGSPGDGDGAGGDAAAEGKALAQARTLLLDALSKEGLERIDQAEVVFDPVVHDAVSHLPAEEASGPDAGDGTSPDPGEPSLPRVGQVLRAGYRWRGQTLRPAMVQVRG